MSAELAVRTFVLPRSQSATTIRQARISGSRLSANENNVVVLGNSYTLKGIASADLQKMSKELEPKTHLSLHALNGSYICEWYWMSRLFFLSSEIKPDVLVLNVGKTSLLDRDRVEYRRLALTFGANNYPVLPDIGNKTKNIEFLLSRVSMLINRGRNIGEQLASRVIPDFESMRRTMIDRKKKQGEHVAEVGKASKEQKAPTVETFLQLIKESHTANTRLIIVLMPQRDKYQLDQPLVDLIEANIDRLDVLDHRKFDRIGAQHFRDEVHMTDEGKAIYSPFYAEELATLLEKVMAE